MASLAISSKIAKGTRIMATMDRTRLKHIFMTQELDFLVITMIMIAHVLRYRYYDYFCYPWFCFN